jgi:hypothetical protein
MVGQSCRSCKATCWLSFGFEEIGDETDSLVLVIDPRCRVTRLEGGVGDVNNVTSFVDGGDVDFLEAEDGVGDGAIVAGACGSIRRRRRFTSSAASDSLPFTTGDASVVGRLAGVPSQSETSD